MKDEQYVAEAKRLYTEKDTIELAHPPAVYRGVDVDNKPGAWVQAWLWVDDLDDDPREGREQDGMERNA